MCVYVCACVCYFSGSMFGAKGIGMKTDLCPHETYILVDALDIKQGIMDD